MGFHGSVVEMDRCERQQYGIGRPYLDRDPPHVAPIDGKEYASRRGGAKAQHAEANVKKNKQVAARADRSAKPTRFGTASQGRRAGCARPGPD